MTGLERVWLPHTHPVWKSRGKGAHIHLIKSNQRRVSPRACVHGRARVDPFTRWQMLSDTAPTPTAMSLYWSHFYVHGDLA